MSRFIHSATMFATSWTFENPSSHILCIWIGAAASMSKPTVVNAENIHGSWNEKLISLRNLLGHSMPISQMPGAVSIKLNQWWRMHKALNCCRTAIRCVRQKIHGRWFIYWEFHSIVYIFNAMQISKNMRLYKLNSLKL